MPPGIGASAALGFAFESVLGTICTAYPCGFLFLRNLLFILRTRYYSPQLRQQATDF